MRCDRVLASPAGPQGREEKDSPSRNRRWTNTFKKRPSPRRPTQIPANGSLWSPSARFSDLASDLRARRVDDIVTIVVQESASATSTGATKTSRTSSAKSEYHRPGRHHSSHRTPGQSGQPRKLHLARRRRRHQPSNHSNHHGLGASHACARERQSGGRRHQEREHQLRKSSHHHPRRDSSHRSRYHQHHPVRPRWRRWRFR